MEKIIDNLGRVVIPIGMRKQLDLEEGSKVNIELKDDSIIIKNSKKVDLKNYIIQLKSKYNKSSEICRILDDIINKIEKGE